MFAVVSDNKISIVPQNRKYQQYYELNRGEIVCTMLNNEWIKFIRPLHRFFWLFTDLHKDSNDNLMVLNQSKTKSDEVKLLFGEKQSNNIDYSPDINNLESILSEIISITNLSPSVKKIDEIFRISSEIEEYINLCKHPLNSFDKMLIDRFSIEREELPGSVLISQVLFEYKSIIDTFVLLPQLSDVLNIIITDENLKKHSLVRNNISQELCIESSTTLIFSSDGFETNQKYIVDHVSNIFALDIYLWVKSPLHVSICDNCKKYFVTRSKSNEKYCSNIYKNTGKSCREVAPTIVHKTKLSNNPYLAEKRIIYDDFYNKRVRRQTNPKLKNKEQETLKLINNDMSSMVVEILRAKKSDDQELFNRLTLEFLSKSDEIRTQYDLRKRVTTNG